MILGKKHEAVAYLQNSSLKLIGVFAHHEEELMFSSKIIKNSQIVDREALKDSIISFLAKTDLKKQHVILVLGEDILFQEIFPLVDTEDAKIKTKNFFDTISVDPQYLIKKTLTNDTEVYLLATNREIYHTLMGAFESVGWKIDKVIPVTFFLGAGNHTSLNLSQAKEILQEPDLIEIANFLNEDDTVKPSSNYGSHFIFNRYFIIFLSTFLLGFLFFAIFKSLLPNFFLHSKQSLSIKPTSIPVAATSTPVQKTNRSDITIKVINGTGINGQAKIVKDSLTKLGYFQITTDNATASGNTRTTIAFSHTVPTNFKDELVTTLNKMFSAVSTTNTSASLQYDIVVITGK